MIGSDAQQHNQAAGYYVTDITIPPVVPDGLYILGWVWFGGTSGPITTNDPQVPKPWSYFSDYWGCSFIKIEGGVPLAQSYTPVFNNDYRFEKNAEGAEGMGNGCMAQNDRPGVCVSEPCKGVQSFYRKPAAFKSGPPKPLTPANFGGEGADTAPNPPSSEAKKKAFKSCICIRRGRSCSAKLAGLTSGCKAKTRGYQQRSECKKSCCSVCKFGKSRLCKRVRGACKNY